MLIPPIPDSLSDLSIPEMWQKTASGQQWIFSYFELEGNERIIIFCTEMQKSKTSV